MRGHVPSGVSYCKMGAMCPISTMQEEAKTREGRNQVCVRESVHMHARVYIQRSASGTGPPIFCTQAVGPKAQALGVPQLPP